MMTRKLHNRTLYFALSTLITVAGILYVHPASGLNFLNFSALWCGFIYIFHHEDFNDFALVFLVNSAFISLFYIVQITVFPDSYGTTHPLGSWTDDSHFFSLAADTVPQALQTRNYYYLYSQPFSNIIRATSLFSINHPMDAIFFQSGIAALLCTFTKRFLLLRGADPHVAWAGLLLPMICPFLMMHGGVILLRDTFCAALFVYSLCCIDSRRFPLALAALLIQATIRPGTAAILLLTYFMIYLPSTRELNRRNLALMVFGLPILMLTGAIVSLNLVDTSAVITNLSKVGLTGRELIEDLLADPGSNQLFLKIQEQPFVIRFVLNGIYMFMYPFLNIKAINAMVYFDIRTILLSIVVPVQAFWINAWFIAGLIARKQAFRQQRKIALSVVVTLLMLGTYSLQTRHKTITYGLYYAIVAAGMLRSTRQERQVGYGISGAMFAIQLVMATR